MYKKRIPYFRPKSIPVEEVKYELVAVDCSCEIWMILFRMQFNPIFIEFFEVYFLMNSSIIEIERFVIKYLINEVRKIKEKIERMSKCLLVFESNGYNQYKKKILKKRQKERNDAYKDFIIALKISGKDVSKRYLEYLHTDANYFQQQVSKCFSSTISSGDSDLFLSSFKVVYSHDMDLLLFGCNVLITNISGDDISYKSIGDILRQWKVPDRAALVDICILLGTDYNEGHKDLTFSQCRKMNTELSADQKEVHDLFLRQAKAL